MGRLIFGGGLAVLGCALWLAPILALLTLADFSLVVSLIEKPNFKAILSATLFPGLSAALLSVSIGLGFARFFASHDWRGQRAERLLLLIPFLVPNFVLASAYVLAWNPATGLLNSFFRFPLGLYGHSGLIALFAVAHAPVAFLVLEDKFKRIDDSLREAARLSGAGPTRIFWSIEFPLLLPSIVSSLALSFVLNAAAFAIPAWIGAPARAYTLSYKIYQAIQIGGVDGFPQAAGYAVILVSLVVPLLIGLSLATRKDRKLVSGKGTRSRKETLAPKSMLAFQFVFLIYQVVTWIAPLGCLFLSTLVPPGCLQANGLSCLMSSSLKTYLYVLRDLPETKDAFLGSYLWGSLASVTILMASIAALALTAQSRLTVRLVDWTLAVAASTPGAIIALGLIVVASGQYGLNLYNTAWIVVAAFVLKHSSLAFQPLRAGFESISDSLSEAARLSGATVPQVWARIFLPILKPELIGGFFLVLVPILGELTMSIFLVSPSYKSIGTLLFDLQDYADQASAAALSVILVVSVLLTNEFARLVSRGRLGY